MNQSRSRSLENIGLKQCRKRRQVSLVAFALTVVLFVTLRVTNAEQNRYLFLFPPTWLAVLALMQAREKT